MKISPEKSDIMVLQTRESFFDSKNSDNGVKSIENNPAKNNGTKRLLPIIKIKTITIINKSTASALR